MAITENWRGPLVTVLKVLVSLIVVMLIITSYRCEIATALPESFILGTPERLEDLLISVWSAIAVFVFIGVTSLLVSLRNPQDELIESRLKYLFSGDRVTKGVTDYNMEQINKLSAFTTNGKMQISINEWDDETEAYKLEITGEQSLENGFHNIPYVDKSFDIRIAADVIDGKEVLGEFKRLEFFTSLEDSSESKLPERVVLTKDTPDYKSEVSVEIEPNGAIRYAYSYWIWCAKKAGFSMVGYRYSENLSVTAVNQTDIPLAIEFDQNGIKRDAHTVKPGSNVTMTDNASLAPNHTLLFLIDKTESPTAQKPSADN